jgi:hypothetical protein
MFVITLELGSYYELSYFLGFVPHLQELWEPFRCVLLDVAYQPFGYFRVDGS